MGKGSRMTRGDRRRNARRERLRLLLPRDGAVIGIDRFGASAPGKIVLEKLGINVANVVEHAKKLVNR